LLTYSATIFKDATVFEYHEMRSLLTFPNPPIKNFSPSAPSAEERKLRNYQLYGLAWMELRLEHGAGILGDEIRLCKVQFLVMVMSCHDITV
jgi:hypothetical protein